MYGGAHGLRILTYHETGPAVLGQMRSAIAFARGRLAMATPDDVDAIFEGRYRGGAEDRLLFTCDDGCDSNFEAATLLADAGLRGIFFIVPSFIERTWAECAAFHAANGVKSRVGRDGTRGLSRSQVAEMIAMGHRIGAHNYGHRDLGKLSEPKDLQYEIDRAIDGVAELTGAPCLDFAIAYGQPENLSDAARAYLVERSPRIYACHRGLNVPGRTPRFLLRHDCREDHPEAFTRVCMMGGGDHHLADRAAVVAARAGLLPGASKP